MATPTYRKDVAFAAKYVNELPGPERVLTGDVPPALRDLFIEARIRLDRYWAALAEQRARELKMLPPTAER